MLTSEQRAAYVKAEMQDYFEGCYADHGSAKDQLNRFAQTIEYAATTPLLAEIESLNLQLGAVITARDMLGQKWANSTARIAELEKLRSEDHAHAIDLAGEIERLTRELEEARKDSELLDYIQTNGATVEIIPGAPDFYPVHFRVGGRYRTANENIRSAIRAAIKEQT